MAKRRKKTYNTFFGIILNSKGGLLKTTKNFSEMPRLHSHNYRSFKKEEPLWQLVNLPKEEKNPETFEETREFIQRHCLEDKFNVRCHTTNESWNKTFGHLPKIQAFTRCDYTLGFRMMNKEKSFKAPKVIVKENVFVEPDEYQVNNSSAVKIKLGGLNEAFNLGCISKEEFENLADQLSKTNGSLWLELDDAKKARFATFINGFQCELSEEEETWISLFESIFKYKEQMEEKKKKILYDLIEKLEKYPQNVKSAWTQCLIGLKACIRELKVAVYSKEDESLHAIKNFFCYYSSLKLGKKFRGITLNAGAKNDLTLIKTPGLTFFNFGSYLEFDISDIEKTLPRPVINSTCVSLYKQKKQANTSKTVIKLCKERGLILSRKLLDAYINTGKNFIEQFEYDIFSLPYCSLSSLAFKTIWHKYTRKAGIFHNGLEKTKIFQEDVLRKYCTGGFAYSCRDKVNCGEKFDPKRKNDTLHSSDGFNLNVDSHHTLVSSHQNSGGQDLGLRREDNVAKTIREYDLISSYGYAASNMSCPVGFCTGYTNVEGKNLLERCDKKSRFNSFEFMSVYYTLWKLSKEINVKIKTVYSNFHQYGFLQLGKLTVDLVVITEEGKVMLFAFDGAWAHGCRSGCLSLDRYAGKKTRRELEESSEERDCVINEWCKQINEKKNCINFATYSVITDCHHPEYKVHALKSFFQTVPELKSLTDGYFSNNLISQDDAIFSNEKLTFLALVKGRVPKNKNFPQQHPLFLRGKDKRWDRYSSTDSSEEGILLTRDYLQYLIKEHNFQIEKIEKIYFYKKCFILPCIFKDLVDSRASAAISKEKKQLLKNIVNYAAGYFGYNESKHQSSTSCRLVTEIPQRYSFKLFQSKIKNVAWIKNTRIIFVQVSKINNASRKVSKCALPLYICVTEWGKKRLAETFCYFEKYLMPEKFRILYSNVDNAIICLSTNELDEAVDPKHFAKFLSLKSNYFSTSKPGHLKEEFVIYPESEWKFASGLTHNYAILTKDKITDVHKNSALRKVTSEQAYQASVAFLSHTPYVISQERRTNKMAHLETIMQNFVFK
jgi:hypothetical protein